jgi:hypothetical protein
VSRQVVPAVRKQILLFRLQARGAVTSPFIRIESIFKFTLVVVVTVITIVITTMTMISKIVFRVAIIY